MLWNGPILVNPGPLQKSCANHRFYCQGTEWGYGNGDQVKAQTVTSALTAFSKTCNLVGKPSPILETKGEYILPVSRLVEGFRSQDPPVIQMAVPKSVPEISLDIGYATGNVQQWSLSTISSAARST